MSVGGEGFEPPKSHANGFTCSPGSPTPTSALLNQYAHDHLTIASPEPEGYITTATAQEFAAHQKAFLPYLDNQAAQEHQHAWDTLEARRAELPTPQAELVKDAHDELWEEWLSRHPEQDKELER